MYTWNDNFFQQGGIKKSLKQMQEQGCRINFNIEGTRIILMNFYSQICAFFLHQFMVDMSLFKGKHKIQTPGDNSKYNGI